MIVKFLKGSITLLLCPPNSGKFYISPLDHMTPVPVEPNLEFNLNLIMLLSNLELSGSLNLEFISDED